MNLTYNEILEEMKNVYMRESEKALERGSETEKRLEAVASEVYSVSCYGDFIMKQAFVQTATGIYLDKHGEIRDCCRKRAAFAEGSITFFVDESIDEDITVAEGTVCSVAYKPHLQYATTAPAVIRAGETSVTAPAKALEAGEIYNVLADEICVMVNAPVGVCGAVNDDEFTGGCDEESDSSFRKRIMDSYSVIPNGVNAASLESQILKNPNVYDCHITPGKSAGEIFVIVRIHGFMENIPDILQYIPIVQLIGVKAVIKQAVEKKFSLSVDFNLASGFDKNKIIEKIKYIVKDYCAALKIGNELNLSDVAKQLNDIEAVSNVSVSSPQSYANTVNCGAEEYLHLSETAVKCYEEYNLL